MIRLSLILFAVFVFMGCLFFPAEVKISEKDLLSIESSLKSIDTIHSLDLTDDDKILINYKTVVDSISSPSFYQTIQLLKKNKVIRVSYWKGNIELYLDVGYEYSRGLAKIITKNRVGNNYTTCDPYKVKDWCIFECLW